MKEIKSTIRTNTVGWWIRRIAITSLVLLCSFVAECEAQVSKLERSVVSGGVVVETVVDSAALLRAAAADSLLLQKGGRSKRSIDPSVSVVEKERRPFLSDSMGLSKVAWASLFMPGYGQIYNKQIKKLPYLYGSVAAGTTLYIHENKRYKSYKSEFDALTYGNLFRTDEVDAVQAKMIRANTSRQILLGATVASYLYFIADGSLNYSTNNVSNIKRATTLATIFPGAGQFYNKSYWKLPFVIGGFASVIYVIDWNSRGYNRFKSAYALRYDYDINPDLYPDGSVDEFGGRYTAAYLKSLRDSYRRNRDLSIIIMAGLYILQIIDAHVDAHFKDYDISDDLKLNVTPEISTSGANNSTTVGVGMQLQF